MSTAASAAAQHVWRTPIQQRFAALAGQGRLRPDAVSGAGDPDLATTGLTLLALRKARRPM